VFGKQAASIASFDALTRRRLDRFAMAFDRVNAHDYIQFAIEPSDPDAAARAEVGVPGLSMAFERICLLGLLAVGDGDRDARSVHDPGALVRPGSGLVSRRPERFVTVR